jgi:hypothetical protein
MKTIRIIAVTMVLNTIALMGCESATKTVWLAQSKSSDGAWLAMAHTENTDGPGINAQYTTVEMKQNISTTSPIEVLVLDEDEQAVRDLKMNWISPDHLDITYRGDPQILFQAIKAFGKDVTVEHLSN